MGTKPGWGPAARNGCLQCHWPPVMGQRRGRWVPLDLLCCSKMALQVPLVDAAIKTRKDCSQTPSTLPFTLWPTPLWPFTCLCINYEEALEWTIILVVSVKLLEKENLSSSPIFPFALTKSMVILPVILTVCTVVLGFTEDLVLPPFSVS